MKLNIVMAGAPCSGKSSLSALLFARLKQMGYDYDLIQEESRKIKIDFGKFQNVWERFYMWRQQEREELRSTAINGFISDSPLFHYYIQVKIHAKEKRDKYAVREMFRMCQEIDDRYQLIVIAKDPFEYGYKTDSSRTGDKANALMKHELTVHFVQSMWADRILFVEGDLDTRVQQILDRLLPLLGDPEQETV